MFSRFDNPKTNNKNSEDQQHSQQDSTAELMPILPDARMLFQKLPARKHRGSSSAVSRPSLQEFDCSAEESKKDNSIMRPWKLNMHKNGSPKTFPFSPKTFPFSPPFLLKFNRNRTSPDAAILHESNENAAFFLKYLILAAK